VRRRPLGWLAAVAAGCGMAVAIGSGAPGTPAALAASHSARSGRAALAVRPAILTPAGAAPLVTVAPGHAGPAGLAALPVSAAALYAPGTGQLLVSEGAEQRVAIASTTKLMTALITLQHVRRLATMFTQNDFYPAADDSQIGLVPGERMSVHDLLLALMLPSADDAAEDLAYNIGGGSVTRFIAMMNAEAQRLGLTGTHYSTPSGLDTPGNYSTAADLVRLAQYDMVHLPFLRRIVDLRGAVLRTGSHVRLITNRNDLLGRDGIDGIKTGHTSQAGYVLVASGHKGGMSLISAVLGTPSIEQRDASTLALLRYGYGSFDLRRPVVAGERLARPAVSEQPGVRADVEAAGSVSRVVPRGTRMNVAVTVQRHLAGPLPAGAVVGSATVREDGQVVASVPLVLGRALAAVSSLTLVERFITQPLVLVLIVVLLGGGGWLWRRERRRRARRQQRRRRRLEAA
jgi:D-alanyl-D-alanine carboxypeptidase (penicillin-binding protein 5/6)